MTWLVLVSNYNDQFKINKILKDKIEKKNKKNSIKTRKKLKDRT
jgi:hypothetical protein